MNMLSTYVIRQAKKIQALTRIFPYILQTQKQLLMNAYFMSQFSYCPLVWMNHSRTLNNCINGLHKRALNLGTTRPNSEFKNLTFFGWKNELSTTANIWL